jgi:hypothetical protein
VIRFGVGVFVGCLAAFGLIVTLDWYIRSDWP